MAEINDLSVTDASNTGRWPENMAPSAVNDAGRADEGILARWYRDTNGSLTSGGSSNAYTLSINSTDTVYDGQVLRFEANHSNTGAATLNVTNSGGSAQGAVAIVWPDQSAVISGDIVSGAKVSVVYDATNTKWMLVSPGAQLQQYDALLASLAGLSVVSGDLVYGSAANTVSRLAKGTDGQYLTLSSGLPVWAALSLASSDLPDGAVVNVVNTSTGAVATGTTVLPFDDTVPQNTEGDQYMTLAITPKATTNLLKIDVTVVLSHSVGASNALTAALFQDSTAGALASAPTEAPGGGEMATINFTHYMTAGTTSATTFKVRAGGNSAGTTTFNGTGGARRLGGVSASSITITEIAGS